VSDALVIVISEETGAISLAINGDLIRFLDDKMLRELLMRELQVKAMFSSASPFWRW
ncbi:MAG: TIGR00159 family protein, partial [Desulfitobacteriaceae bacterium]